LLVLLLLVSCVFGVLRFGTVGDWGGQPDKPFTTKVEVQVAKQLGITSAEIETNFTIAVGDNFYNLGVKDEYDPRFKETFEVVYTAKSLQSRWYVLAGNHDHWGNVTGQIAYTNHSPRWYFPSEWYTETFPLDEHGHTVQILFIDTVVIAGDWPDGVPQALGPVDPQKAHAELQWIENTLKASTADWILCAGHYPVWSVAEHGPTQILVEHLKPLLEKYNVAAYFNGHDHNLQHLKETDKQVNYFVVGASHDAEDNQANKGNVPHDSLKYFWPNSSSDSDGGFATFEIQDNNTMTVSFIEDTGRVLYKYNINNPRMK